MVLQKLSSLNKGFVLILISCFFYAALNSSLKFTVYTIHPLLLLFCQNFCAVVFLFPLVINRYKKDLQSLIQRPLILPNLIRCCFGFVGNILWLTALSNMNITECVAISFTTPIFIMVFSILTLKERADIYQWILIIIGFSAAIFIKQPDIEMFNYYGFLVIAAAGLWAISVVMLKKFIVSYIHPIAIMFFASCVTALLSMPFAIYHFIYLDLISVSLIMLSCFFAIIAKTAAAFAYKFSKLCTVIPLDFNRLVFTSILAYIIFDELLSRRTAIGALVIILSSTYLIYLHNRALNK